MIGCSAACANPNAREGEWQLLECTPAWDGNWTWDGFICFAWHGPGPSIADRRRELRANQSQCYLHIPFDEFKAASCACRT